MLQRVITGSILVLLVAIFVWVPGFRILLALFITALATVAAWEYFHIVEPVNWNILSITTMVLVPVTVLSGLSQKSIAVYLFLILSFIVLSILYTFNRTSSINKYVHAFFGFLSLLLLRLGTAHLLILHRTLQAGTKHLIYHGRCTLRFRRLLCGKNHGKHALAPEISL